MIAENELQDTCDNGRLEDLVKEKFAQLVSEAHAELGCMQPALFRWISRVPAYEQFVIHNTVRWRKFVLQAVCEVATSCLLL